MLLLIWLAMASSYAYFEHNVTQCNCDRVNSYDQLYTSGSPPNEILGWGEQCWIECWPAENEAIIKCPNKCYFWKCETVASFTKTDTGIQFIRMNGTTQNYRCDYAYQSTTFITCAVKAQLDPTKLWHWCFSLPPINNAGIFRIIGFAILFIIFGALWVKTILDHLRYLRQVRIDRRMARKPKLA